MTAILGAQTDQLAALAQRLNTTGTEIDGVQTETARTATTVVSEMQHAFGTALSGIESAMSSLRTTVEAAHSQLGETTWTGSNQATFESGYSNFNSAMASFENAVRGAYDQFNGQMEVMGSNIEDFQAQVATSMSQAQDSALSMSKAVTDQQTNLEQAMNGSLTFS